MNESVFILIILWLLYFGLHSLLATNRLKSALQQRLPRMFPYYRLLFNLIAIITLLPLVYLLYMKAGAPLWQWQGWWAWFANALAAIALMLFFWSLRYYSGADFLGLRVFSGNPLPQQHTLVLSPLHRWVRHPWYTLGLVIVWSRDMDLLWLISALAITLYFFIGSKWEEKKLVAEFGSVYQRYQQRVPALVPLPWKHLSRTEAAQLQQE